MLLGWAVRTFITNTRNIKECVSVKFRVIYTYFSGAIYGATELLNLKGCTKETYFKDNRLPDWIDIKDSVRTL